MFGHPKFGIETLENDEFLTLALAGEIDSTTAGQFDTEMMSACAKCKNLIVDFAKVVYISSAGLRVLLNTHRKMIAENGKMTLVNIGEAVREVFGITGFADVLNIGN